MNRFTIITPSLLRESLWQTIESVFNQDYPQVQHIISIDKPAESRTHKEQRLIVSLYEFAAGLPFGRELELLELGRSHNDFGNTPRHVAWHFVTGDYILYLDDDDVHINKTLWVIQEYLEKEPVDWGIFPAWRLGSRFFNNPPGLCQTVSCQWFHRPVIEGVRMQWPTEGSYTADGQFLDNVKNLQPNYGVIEGVELCQVNKISEGKVDG